MEPNFQLHSGMARLKTKPVSIRLKSDTVGSRHLKVHRIVFPGCFSLVDKLSQTEQKKKRRC
jgi:hypothetical protein